MSKAVTADDVYVEGYACGLADRMMEVTAAWGPYPKGSLDDVNWRRGYDDGWTSLPWWQGRPTVVWC